MKLVPVLLAITVSLIVFACGKDKFETKPLIEVRSISSKELPQNGVLTIKLDFFDKEGDLGNGDFFAAKLRLNQLPLGTSSPDLVDTFYYTLPDFQPRDKGEISLQLDYNRLKESINENDTIMFRLAVTDAAGNKSDTINTEPIVILLP